MPNLIQEVSTPVFVVASGSSVLLSGNCALLGWFINSGTPGTINLAHGVLASGAVTAAIASGILGVTGNFFRFPCYGSGGLTVNLSGWTTPVVTFFINPMPKT